MDDLNFLLKVLNPNEGSSQTIDTNNPLKKSGQRMLVVIYDAIMKIYVLLRTLNLKTGYNF